MLAQLLADGREIVLRNFRFDPYCLQIFGDDLSGLLPDLIACWDDEGKLSIAIPACLLQLALCLFRIERDRL